MCGLAGTDPVIKYCDQAIGATGECEVAWYLGKAWASCGPVLDLAGGTGRPTLLTPWEGFRVTGIDSSGRMLNVSREKLTQELLAVQRRVPTEEQLMSDFDLGRRSMPPSAAMPSSITRQSKRTWCACAACAGT